MGYRSIPGSIGSHYLPSVTYLNCYGCCCLWSLNQPCVFPRSPFIERGIQRCLLSPNKDTSPPQNKSMLTVCLHRLGHSRTLWFLIRHMMSWREIGIWEKDYCIGKTDLILFAFHPPALMEMILIHASQVQQRLSGGGKKINKKKPLHFTFGNIINLCQLPYKMEMKCIFSVDSTGCLQDRQKWKAKRMEKISSCSGAEQLQNIHERSKMQSSQLPCHLKLLHIISIYM